MQFWTLKEISYTFPASVLLQKLLKQAKIIWPFSVQLFSILPRKIFICIIKSVQLTISGRPHSSAFVPVALHLILDITTRIKRRATRTNVEEHGQTWRKADKRGGKRTNVEECRQTWRNADKHGGTRTKADDRGLLTAQILKCEKKASWVKSRKVKH